jgi:hypothetical protein
MSNQRKLLGIECLDNPTCFDIDFSKAGLKYIIVIGDVHGCYDELEELLALISKTYYGCYQIFLGDLIDRGPKNLECIGIAHDIAEVIIGNHERKLLRYCVGDWPQSGFEPTASQAWMKELSEADKKEVIDFYRHDHSAYRIKIGDRIWTFTHAAASLELYTEPFEHSKVWELSKKAVNICWYGWTTGKRDSLTGYPERLIKPVPEGFTSVFGHMVHPKDNCVFKWQPEASNTGISIQLDHGCCFGDYLSALVIDIQTGNYHLESIKAKKVYSGYKEHKMLQEL